MTDSLLNTDIQREVRCDGCGYLGMERIGNQWCRHCGNYLITVVKRDPKINELVARDSSSTPES